MNCEKLVLTNEWDKTFPKSEKVLWRSERTGCWTVCPNNGGAWICDDRIRSILHRRERR